MTNKGIREIPLFDPILPKMDCPLFGVTTVFELIDGIQVESGEGINFMPLFLHTETSRAQSLYVYVNGRSR